MRAKDKKHKMRITLYWEDVFFYAAIALVFSAVLIWGRPVFAINDDLGLYDVLSGAYLGYPDGHVSFMEYPLSFLIALLYRICRKIPWYGIVMECMMCACAAAIYRRSSALLKRTVIRKEKIFLIKTFLCLSLLGMLLIGMLRLQYTVVSGVCGAAALFLFVTSEDKRSVGVFLLQNIGTVGFALLAECIRPEMLYMILIFAGVLWLVRLILGGFEFRKYLSLVGIFVCCLFVILGISAAAYRSDEWKTFRVIDRCRVSLFDYYGYPSYEENRAYFQEHGIEQSVYESISHLHMYVGRDLSAKQWSDIVALAKRLYEEKHPVSERLAGIFPAVSSMFRAPELRPMTDILLLWYLLVLFAVLALRDRRGMILLAGAAFSQFFSLAVLVYRGRLRDRIFNAMFFMEFSVLLGIFLLCLVSGKREMEEGSAKRVKNIAYLIGLAALVLVTGFLDCRYFLRLRDDFSKRQQDVWNGLRDYCRAHDDCFYVWTGGSNTLYYFYDTPFDSDLCTRENFVLMVSGHMMNPNTQKRLLGYGVESLTQAIVTDDRFFFMVREDSVDALSVLFHYCREKYGAFGFAQKDLFEAGDVRFAVYQLISEQ